MHVHVVAGQLFRRQLSSHHLSLSASVWAWPGSRAAADSECTTRVRDARGQLLVCAIGSAYCTCCRPQVHPSGTAGGGDGRGDGGGGGGGDRRRRLTSCTRS